MHDARLQAPRDLHTPLGVSGQDCGRKPELRGVRTAYGLFRVVHDVEDPELVELDADSRPPLRVNRALVETDLVVVVTAAESVLHGGPAALLGAAGGDALRAAGGYSLLETAGSQGWHLGVALERTLARQLPVIGVSLVLNHPEISGALRGYPYDPEALERIDAKANAAHLRVRRCCPYPPSNPITP